MVQDPSSMCVSGDRVFLASGSSWLGQLNHFDLDGTWKFSLGCSFIMNLTCDHEELFVLRCGPTVDNSVIEVLAHDGTLLRILVIDGDYHHAALSMSGHLLLVESPTRALWRLARDSESPQKVEDHAYHDEHCGLVCLAAMIRAVFSENPRAY
jgi:hypothetical protein